MSSYWGRRNEYVDSLFESTSSNILKRQADLYDSIMKSMKKEMESFMGRYASEGRVSMSVARRYLSPSQLRDFKDEVRGWEILVNKLSKNSRDVTSYEIERYIERLKKLEARVRVTRIESLMASLERYAMEKGIVQDDLFFNTISPEVEDVYDYASFDLDVEQGFSAGLNPIQLDKLFKQRWMDGSFSSRLWKDKDTLMRNLESTLLQGIALGHNPRRIAKDMARRMNSSKVACERLVRTEVLHFFNEATYEAYKEHGVKEYRFIASLDERTCPICGELDGKVFKLSEREEGVNYPVIHPNCRCSTIAYYRIYDEEGKKGTRVARDKEGKLYEVPSNMTYSEWKKKFSK